MKVLYVPCVYLYEIMMNARRDLDNEASAP